MSEREGTSSPLVAVLGLLASVAGVAAANAGRRVAAAAGGWLAVAGLLVASLCFLTVAALRALALALGDIYASLILGCAYLGATLFVALVLALRRR